MIVIYGLVLLLALASANPVDIEEPVLHRDVAISPVADDEINYRLPTDLAPVHYDIKLIPHMTLLEGGDTFDGEVTITFKVLVSTDKIVLHTNKMTVDWLSIAVSKSPGVFFPLSGEPVWDPVRHFYTITLNTPLTAMDGDHVITMKYTGLFGDDMQGFYRSSYIGADGNRRWLATTQLEATEARRAFPCFDEPAMKATFSISFCLKKDSGMFAIANTPEESKILDQDDDTLEWTNFKKTPIMSTYLIAFVVSDFLSLVDTRATPPLRIFAQPPMIEQARYSLSVSPALLNYMAEYTKIPFEIEKMDEIAVPDFDAGAMENWGLVTYRERLILFDEKVSTSETKQRIATVIGHEYAHQWFGNLVSPKWWTYIWLNEGFASYFEFFGTSKVETEWRLEEQFIPRQLQTALSADALDTSHPMTYDVCSPDSIAAVFDTINYNKASSVIRMMKHIVGESTFRDALYSYLQFRQLDVADDTDLFNKMAENHEVDHPNEPTRLNINTIMRSWVDQMGYPVLNVTRDYMRGWTTVTQNRFLLKKTVEDPHEYKWHIPLTYTNQIDKDFDSMSTKQWFGAEDSMVVIADHIPKDKWILFNIQESGFYRVNYDAENWKLLTSHLSSDDYTEIHTLNRAQLLDDSFNLARAGYISYTTALDLSTYLEHEIDYIPWMSAFRALSFINNKLNNHESYSEVQMYIRRLLTKLYTEVGFDESASDGHVMKMNRAAAVAWACRTNEQDCVAKAKSELGGWMTTPTVNSIIPDLRSAVYCTALREGGRTEWDFMLQRYKDSTVSSEATLIVSSLGCSSDTTILKSYLEMSIAVDSDIRRQDMRSVFTSVYSNPKGIDTALEFLIGNWQQIAGMYGGLNSIGSLFTGIANQLNTQAQADKLTKFFEDNLQELTDAGATNAMAASRSIVDETLKWQGAYSKTIVDWIEEYLTVGPTTPTTTTLEPTPDPNAASFASISSVLFALTMCIYILF